MPDLKPSRPVVVMCDSIHINVIVYPDDAADPIKIKEGPDQYIVDRKALHNINYHDAEEPISNSMYEKKSNDHTNSSVESSIDPYADFYNPNSMNPYSVNFYNTSTNESATTSESANSNKSSELWVVKHTAMALNNYVPDSGAT